VIGLFAISGKSLKLRPEKPNEGFGLNPIQWYLGSLEGKSGASDSTGSLKTE
jgi:hypothetical protein